MGICLRTDNCLSLSWCKFFEAMHVSTSARVLKVTNPYVVAAGGMNTSSTSPNCEKVCVISSWSASLGRFLTNSRRITRSFGSVGLFPFLSEFCNPTWSPAPPKFMLRSPCRAQLRPISSPFLASTSRPFTKWMASRAALSAESLSSNSMKPEPLCSLVVSFLSCFTLTTLPQLLNNASRS